MSEYIDARAKIRECEPGTLSAMRRLRNSLPSLSSNSLSVYHFQCRLGRSLGSRLQGHVHLGNCRQTVGPSIKLAVDGGNSQNLSRSQRQAQFSYPSNHYQSFAFHIGTGTSFQSAPRLWVTRFRVESKLWFGAVPSETFSTSKSSTTVSF